MTDCDNCGRPVHGSYYKVDDDHLCRGCYGTPGGRRRTRGGEAQPASEQDDVQHDVVRRRVISGRSGRTGR